ncbi:CsbD family protein [Sphaerothrix gracilis]|uniref:CsbD family protein n=1 Tax=Sphaerothrix gracilis TaxID=3151835 RepID=UPI0031FCA1E3
MKTFNLASSFVKAVQKQLAIAFAVLLVAGSLFVSAAPVTAAVGADASRVAPGSKAAADVVQERAKRETDRMLGAGTSDKVEGAVEGTVGKAKRQAGDQFDDFGTQVEGAAEQAEGRVKRDIGRAKGAAAEASDKAEDAGESLIDNIKDFFN